MPKRDGDESSKNNTYGIWLKPKYLIMDNQQPSREKRKAQRLFLMEVECK